VSWYLILAAGILLTCLPALSCMLAVMAEEVVHLDSVPSFLFRGCFVVGLTTPAAGVLTVIVTFMQRVPARHKVVWWVITGAAIMGTVLFLIELSRMGK
jgi:hypothetical protein